MPILALPPGTVRLLGSPLVITTPVSLIKELVENAIDAGATSIEVLVSQDTVQNVEVRDNGRGIHPTDFDMLGRRGHTSKLRTFEEVKTIGGSTLGFRGEALASANVLAKVTVTTRTLGEPVATKLHLLGAGGVAKQEPASAPVGTSVKVSNLFHQLPVRRQTAVKEASKTIAKIKDLLQSHALARLGIKYSFKVLGKPKLAWSYNPGKRTTVREAVLRVFGSELTGQCVEATAPEADDVAPDAPISPISQTDAEYDIDAFLPKADANPAAVSKRAFVYVDSRPISTSKGTARKLVSMFRAHLNRTSNSAEASLKFRDPFIRIHIRCGSPSSYDPNIEPSKDDVLFVDEQLLLERFESLLSHVYPPPKCNSSVSREEDGIGQGPQKVTKKAVTPPCEQPLQLGESLTRHTATGAPSNNVLTTPRVQKLHLLSASAADRDEARFQARSLTSLRDRTQLGVNKALKPQAAINHPHTPPSHPPPIRPETTTAQRGQEIFFSPSRTAVPEPSKPRKELHINFSANPNIPGSLRAQPPEIRNPTEGSLEGCQNIPSKALNPWEIAKLGPSRGLRDRGPIADTDSELDRPILRAPGGVPRDLELPPAQKVPRLRSHNSTLTGAPLNPYRSPVSSPLRITKATLNTTPTTNGRKEKRARNTALRSPPPSVGPESKRLARPWPRRVYPERFQPPVDCRAMDQNILTFEVEKGLTVRAKPAASDGDSEVSSPVATAANGHAAIRGPTTADPSGAIIVGPSKSAIAGPSRSAVADPSTAAAESLPLEVCTGETTSLRQTINISIESLKGPVNTAVRYDTYVKEGKLNCGLDMRMNLAEITRLQNRLQAVLGDTLASDIELDLVNRMKGKSKAHFTMPPRRQG